MWFKHLEIRTNIQIGSLVSKVKGRSLNSTSTAPVVLIKFDGGKKFWMPSRIVREIE
jgi:hypothetical protein